MIMRGFSTFPYISSINSKYKRSHSLSGPPVVIMKKEMTELENKIKLLKLKIAKTKEIIHKTRATSLGATSAINIKSCECGG